ncbi:adenosine deaminase CECR1 [Elysia marginata]|uniref:Adenosine deaminase CECR1 n=1 Tax=Elysia marginata TaxID=1093978 RepID=A0AAV4HZY5_9GAST|nr:adenosine deaminase CECR1 [Elysia marginata]
MPSANQFVLTLSALIVTTVAMLVSSVYGAPQAYQDRRAAFIHEETSMRLGSNLKLNFREELVNHYLMVQKELAVEASRLTKQPYLASRHFFQVKEEIEKTSIFDIIRMMPKGGILHLHDASIVSSDWIVKNMTYLPHLYTKERKGSTPRQFMFSKAPLSIEDGWQNVAQLRAEFGKSGCSNVSLKAPDKCDNSLDEIFLSELSLFTPDPYNTYKSENDIWEKFGHYFSTISGLRKSLETAECGDTLDTHAPHRYASYPHLYCLVGIAAEGILKFQHFEACDPPLRFLEPGLQTLSDIPSVMVYFMNRTLWNLNFEAISRIVILLSHLMSSSTRDVFSSLVKVFGRPDFGSSSRIVRPFPNQFDYNGTDITDEYMRLVDRVVKEFQDTHQDFLGVKFILTGSRSFSEERQQRQVNRIVDRMRKFPNLVKGFDMDGHEEFYHRILFYLDELINNNTSDLPFFFHAGETAWTQGADMNLVDAVLLNATRIGHGFAVLKHPKVMEAIRKQGIVIEVQPVSNQVLGFVNDLRAHPGAVLIANNDRITISSDDFGAWGALPLSHDFYMAFMGLGSTKDDIRLLKQLAINSIKFSTMTEVEKVDAMEKWQLRWTTFIDDVITKYHLL